MAKILELTTLVALIPLLVLLNSYDQTTSSAEHQGVEVSRNSFLPKTFVPNRDLSAARALPPTLGKKVSVRTGHVFGGAETDYVISSASSNTTAAKIQVFRPADTTTPSLTISPPAPNTNLRLLDVIDLDQDGFDDIIAFNANSGQSDPAQGALYVFDKNSAQPKATLLSQSGTFCNGSGGTVFGNTGLVPKIYKRLDGKYNIVVALSTAGTGFPGSVFFLKANPNGSGILPPMRIDLPAYTACPGQCVNCNDGIEFPAIAVDDIDAAARNGKEVVILSKSRLLVFSEDGTKYYFKQFVDPNHGFTDYTAMDSTGVQGRRYGHIQIVNDLDGDGKKDLVVLADALPLSTTGGINATFAVLQAFHLDTPTSANPNGGYERTIGNVIQIPGANSGLTAGAPRYGLTVDGIQDVDGDGAEEVIVSNNTPAVQVFKFRSGSWQSVAQFPGTCLDVVKLDRSRSVPDIIVYNGGTISFYSWNGSSFSSRQNIPASNPPTQFDSSNFNLSGMDFEKHGSAADYARLITVNSAGEKYFLQDAKTGFGTCGTIKSFGSINGTIVQGLNMTSYPGRIQYVSNLEDSTNSTYLINRFDATCVVTGTVDPFIQQGVALVPKAGGSNMLTINPSSLLFSAAFGGSNPVAQTLSLTSGTGPISYNTIVDASWLSVIPASGTAPGSASVSVNISGLSVGTYAGLIQYRATDGSLLATVQVTLAVTAQLSVSPTSLSFSAMQGGANPPSQTLSINSSGGSVNFGVSASVSWLSFSPFTGSTPGSSSVTAKISALAAGTYNATITVSTAASGSVTVPVTLTITGGPGLTANPSSLVFTAMQGGANPPSQVLNIGSTSGQLQWIVSASTTRISFSQTSGTTPGATNVSVDISGLSGGTFSQFAITIAAPGVPSLSVPVGLSITGGIISVNPTSLAFTAVQGGSKPPNQSLNITSSSSAVSWTGSTNASWLTITPTSGTTPSTVTASVNTSLAAGNYSASITFQAGASGSTTVPVSLTLMPSGGGTDFITNGGFEGGISPWVASGITTYINNASLAHSGTGSISLGTDSFVGGAALYQQFTIPSTATSANLTFFLYVTSPLNTTTAFDKMYFEVTNTSNQIQQSLGNVSNLDKGAASAYIMRGPYDLSAFKGQTIRVRFRSVSSNLGGGTEFHLDDVSVK